MNAVATTRRPARPRRDSVINIRMPAMVRDLIDNAASLMGKTRTDFIVESARQQAVDVLLDQRFFSLSEEQYSAFIAALDGPPMPNEKLKRLMVSKSPWEK